MLVCCSYFQFACFKLFVSVMLSSKLKQSLSMYHVVISLSFLLSETDTTLVFLNCTFFSCFRSFLASHLHIFSDISNTDICHKIPGSFVSVDAWVWPKEFIQTPGRKLVPNGHTMLSQLIKQLSEAPFYRCAMGIRESTLLQVPKQIDTSVARKFRLPKCLPKVSLLS